MPNFSQMFLLWNGLHSLPNKGCPQKILSSSSKYFSKALQLLISGLNDRFFFLDTLLDFELS